MELASGHVARPLEDEEKMQYDIDHPGPWNDVVRLQPDGWILCRRYLQLQKKIHEFKFRPDDVVVMTYPKCGTTWTQEIVWTMRNNPNLDNPDEDDALFVRSPYLELDMLIATEHITEQQAGVIDTFLKGLTKYCPHPDVEGGIMFQLAEAHKIGRTIKTHLPFSLLPSNLLDTCKVVYVTRNVKDQLLSAQHHYRVTPMHNFSGTQDTFVDYYVRDMLLYGSYGKHMLEAWKHRDHTNFHLVFYEDLKADVIGEMKRLDAFLGTGLTEEQFQNVKTRTNFSKMKKDDDANKNKLIEEGLMTYNMQEETKGGYFFRKGEAGDWKGKFTPEQEAKLDAYISKYFDGLDIGFKYQ